jgi:hypothetical protein
MRKVVGQLFVLLGILMLGAAIWTGKQQYDVLNHWPKVEAEVTSSRVAQGLDSEGTMMYKAAIEFRYAVDGREFSAPAASNISTSNFASVKREVDRYAVGTRHPIRHNPENPNDLRFDAGYTIGFFFLPVLLGGMGIVFAGVGIAVVLTSRPAR